MLISVHPDLIAPEALQAITHAIILGKKPKEAIKAFANDEIVPSLAHGAAAPVAWLTDITSAVGQFGGSGDVAGLQVALFAATVVGFGILWGSVNAILGTLIAENFAPEVRYTGASLGYQLGSILGGIATPTEAASVGSMGAMLLALVSGAVMTGAMTVPEEEQSLR